LNVGCVSAAARPDTDDPLPLTDDALGGQLYDKWYADTPFVPDNKKTAGVADGTGGPFQNGTLAGADGTPARNDLGHDYRLKNFLGWDLRGADGISGPQYQKKPFALAKNLLTQTQTAEEIEQWLTKGDGALPAYGSVLSAQQLKALALFISRVQSGSLPRPEQVWQLAPTAGHYTLNPGADLERGAALVKARCNKCHGVDGTKLMFDDGAWSLGAFSRQKAYEGWFKILNGHPASKMKRQVRGQTGPEMAQELLDILAALCDRQAFPRGTGTEPDVADGDPRCGAYLR
jgi:hypothetical protein